MDVIPCFYCKLGMVVIMILVMTRSFMFRKLHGDNEFDGALFNVDEHCNCRHAKLFLDSNSIQSILKMVVWSWYHYS